MLHFNVFCNLKQQTQTGVYSCYMRNKITSQESISSGIHLMMNRYHSWLANQLQRHTGSRIGFSTITPSFHTIKMASTFFFTLTSNATLPEVTPNMPLAPAHIKAKPSAVRGWAFSPFSSILRFRSAWSVGNKHIKYKPKEWMHGHCLKSHQHYCSHIIRGSR